MAFFNLPWRGRGGPEATQSTKRQRRVDPPESADVLRRRARNRLIGSAVLLVAGVVVFPLLFDTQPRPIPVDIPIAIPDRDRAPALVLPNADGGGTKKTVNGDVTTAASAKSTQDKSRVMAGLDANEEVITADGKPEHSSKTGSGVTSPTVAPEVAAVPPPIAATAKATAVKDSSTKDSATKDNAGKDHSAKEPSASASAHSERKPADASRSTSAPAPGVSVAPKSASTATDRTRDSARARALLEGRPEPAPASVAVASASTSAAPTVPDGSRYVVQIGAFGEMDKAQEIRQKLEQSGLKTFVQSVDTPQGKRHRVRVGPFANKGDADRAAGRIRTLSLPASVLTL